MAALVLLSTLSITIEKHYCADTLVDVAVFTEIESCCSSKTPSKANTEGEEEGCCNNEINLLVGQDELSLTKAQSLSPTQVLYAVAVAYIFSGKNINTTEDKPDFKAYVPPDPAQDIQLLNEVFLI